MSSDAMQALGIIAGSRSLPLNLVREARAAGIRPLIAVAFEGETDPGLAKLVDEIVWIRVGQLDRLIQAFVDRGVKRCVMAGQIAPKHLYDLRPDIRAMKLLWYLKNRNAHTLFGAIGDELAKEGVTLIEATPWLQNLMPLPGFQIGSNLSAQEAEDVRYGFQIAKQIAALDIGQTVVVKAGTVLAVEGFEGTDACLTRGGELAGKEGGAVGIKVTKPNHDLRFDIPCVGPRTLETCAKSGVRVLAFEAKLTLLLDQDEVAQVVKKQSLTLISTG